MSSPSSFVPLDTPFPTTPPDELPDLPPGPPRPSPHAVTSAIPIPQSLTSSPIPTLAKPLGHSPASTTGGLFSSIPPIQLENIQTVPRSKPRGIRSGGQGWIGGQGWTGGQQAVAGPSQVLDMQYGQGMALQPIQASAGRLDTASPQHIMTGGTFGQTQPGKPFSLPQAMPAQMFPVVTHRPQHALMSQSPLDSNPAQQLQAMRQSQDPRSVERLPAHAQQYAVRPIQKATLAHNAAPVSPIHNPRQSAAPLYQSRPAAPSVASSGAETESGVESDTTVRPRRLRTHSASQPDLVALRNRLEGWAGDVAARQAEGKKGKDTGGTTVSSSGTSWDTAISAGKASEVRRRASHGRKTPPSRRIAMSQQTIITPDTASRSTVFGDIVDSGPIRSSSPRIRRSTSPKKTPAQNSPRMTAPPLLTSSPDPSPSLQPVGGIPSSEDADDDLDSLDSPSSGSLSFSSKRQDPRRRQSAKEKSRRGSGGLGLDLGVATAVSESEKQVQQERHAKPAEPSNLFPLRLLAVFPAVWGCLVLLQGAIFGGLWVNLYPWGVDTSPDALERVLLGNTLEGVWGTRSRGDLLLAAIWALLTGHYCFGMTTGLTHRWRVYYDLPATITRLLSIQCICWPLTGLTLWVLGPDRILFAWVVIGCTTAGSRSVQMYVTSNISLVTDQHGEITPRLKTGALPGRRRSMRLDAEQMDETGGGDGEAEEELDLDWWEKFRMDRKWDWDLVARRVGWKLGSMLLVTCAWLFWGIETGRLSK